MADFDYKSLVACGVQDYSSYYHTFNRCSNEVVLYNFSSNICEFDAVLPGAEHSDFATSRP